MREQLQQELHVTSGPRAMLHCEHCRHMVSALGTDTGSYFCPRCGYAIAQTKRRRWWWPFS